MLLKDIIQIPEQLGSEDFVLRLTEGVSDAQARKTLDDYVITPEIAGNFDVALGILQSALGLTVAPDGTVSEGPHQAGRAVYLHGSFGSGKSHFMAVLHLLLRGNARALNRPELAGVIPRHQPWLGTKRFLLVPYHMLGANTLEERVFDDYARLVEKLHPEAKPPALFDADGLIADAEGLRESFGDEPFFKKLGKGAADKRWGKVTGGWDAARYKAALAARPSDPERQALATLIAERLFPGSARRQGTVRFDEGLVRMSQHARDLGYDGIVLFLDELILWLATKAAMPGFLGSEIDKVVNLVEAQRMDRPIPIVSFIARQRDLRELIGQDSVGAEQLAIDDKLSHHQGRFRMIELSTADLPEIASKRLLQPLDMAGRQAIDAAFERVIGGPAAGAAGSALREALLGESYTLEDFRKVYPFSPALVDTLIAAASMLQRDRTALRAMLQLLIEHRETLDVGEVIPVGDLYDVIRHGKDAITPAFERKFDMAQQFYEQKLVPQLEREHKRSRQDVVQLGWDDSARVRWRADERVLKTVLLSHLVPNVSALQHLTAQRIAALNHGSITTIIPGGEVAVVASKLRAWSAVVPELQLSGDGPNPQVSLALHGVDVEGVLRNAASHDNHGNRVALLKEIVLGELGIDTKQLEMVFPFTWRGTKRQARVVFRNVRELAFSSLENDGTDWQVVIDYPVDEDPAGPSLDQQRVTEFLARGRTARTLVWRPAFLNQRARDELGTLVRLERVLRSDQSFEQDAAHLSAEDRARAKPLLEGQRQTLRRKVVGTLMAAYGLSNESSSVAGLDEAVVVGTKFVSLDASFQPRPPAVGKFEDGLEGLLDQALEHQFPKAPHWEKSFAKADVKRALEIALKAAGSHPPRVELDSAQAKLMREFAVPLELGRCTSAFELGDIWLNHFNRMLAKSGGPVATVRDLREWTDEPEARGLPREVQDLLAIAYAAKGERAFYRAGASLREEDVRIDGLQPGDELRKIPLPSEEAWRRALDRAGAIFGETNPELFCNGPNAASLAGRVREHVREHRKAAGALREKLLEATPQDQRGGSNRLKDADAVLDLFDQLDVDSAKELIEHLADARIEGDLTPESLGASWRQAQPVIEAIAATNWDLIDVLRGVPEGDSVHARAQAVLEKLASALGGHQHAMPLPQALREAVRHATEIIKDWKQPVVIEGGSGRSQIPEPDPPGMVMRQSAVLEKRGDLDQLAQRLAEELEPDGAIIDVTWEVRPGGNG